MWYRRLEQPVRLGSWYAMNGVVNMVSWSLEHGRTKAEVDPNSLEV